MDYGLVPKAIGVYQIKNTRSGYSYIGSAANLRKRCLQHIWDLDNQKHSNPWLQKVWNKYGTSAFEFYVLEQIEDRDLLLEREQFFLDALIPEYNVCPIAGSAKGRVPSPEHREKLRQANLGKSFTEERKRNIAIGRNKAWEDRPELREIARKNQTGRKYSEATKQKHAERTRRLRREQPERWSHGRAPRPVAQYSLDGTLIATYACAYEAFLATGSGNILLHCDGKIKHPRKFIWKYAK